MKVKNDSGSQCSQASPWCGGCSINGSVIAVLITVVINIIIVIATFLRPASSPLWQQDS